ncbi:MAG: ABC transporter substrate-binding protein [Syntrophotaleaceae bacterium]
MSGSKNCRISSSPRDFNSFYHQSFYKRFVEAGNFVDVAETLPTSSYQKAGILDPEHQYSILGVNPLVMVADLDRLGERPLPVTWDDLCSTPAGRGGDPPRQ